jgi:hypothetical protein
MTDQSKAPAPDGSCQYLAGENRLRLSEKRKSSEFGQPLSAGRIETIHEILRSISVEKSKKRHRAKARRLALPHMTMPAIPRRSRTPRSAPRDLHLPEHLRYRPKPPLIEPE